MWKWEHFSLIVTFWFDPIWVFVNTLSRTFWSGSSLKVYSNFEIGVFVNKFVVLIWLTDLNQYISCEKLGCSTTQCLIYVHIYWAFECLNICRLLIWIKWKSVFMMLICIYSLGWCLPLFPRMLVISWIPSLWPYFSLSYFYMGVEWLLSLSDTLLVGILFDDTFD